MKIKSLSSKSMTTWELRTSPKVAMTHETFNESRVCSLTPPRYNESMTQLVQAIYENGVFRPLDPVHVSEHERVSLVIESVPQPPAAEVLARQRESLRKLRAEMNTLPMLLPQTG